MDTVDDKKEAVKVYLTCEKCVIKNISLKEMFDILINCILTQKECYPTFYYKRKNFNTGNPEFTEITEVDLMYGRFKTIDDDFFYFVWELNESHIYIKEDDYNALYI